MSDDSLVGLVVAMVLMTLIITIGVGMSRSDRLDEESFRICVQAGNSPLVCRGQRP